LSVLRGPFHASLPKTKFRRPDSAAGGEMEFELFGSRTRHQAVFWPRRGRFPVIGSSPHWPGRGPAIFRNFRARSRVDLCVLERGTVFQGHTIKKRKLKIGPPLSARSRKFRNPSSPPAASPVAKPISSPRGGAPGRTARKSPGSVGISGNPAGGWGPASTKWSICCLVVLYF